MNVLMQYYALKNALVASKAGRADSAALLLSTAGDSLRVSIFNDAALAATSKQDLDTIISYSKALAGITDASCERQRLLFGNISSAFYALLKNADLKNAGIYREYCPMAYNEKGAYWLSEETEIKNPYFGKKMLECGEVTDSL
jgi:Cu(I)/Ag(I) efflux system membrane fusion protein